MRNWLLLSSIFILLFAACKSSKSGISTNNSTTSVTKPDSINTKSMKSDSIQLHRIEHSSQNQRELDSIKNSKTKSGMNGKEY